MFKVSIIIPIFNVKDYLKRALDSILNQTMDINDIQVIMVDDKSTDGSDLIAEEYSNKYDNFSLYKLNQNSGSAAKPRNVGLKYVESEYIMFLDPDDEFLPTYCEKMYNCISECDVDLVKCNNIDVTNEGELFIYYFDKDVHKKLIKNSDQPLKYVAIWNGIHKKDFVMKNNIKFPDYFGEDIYFSVKEFLCMDKMIYLNDYFGYRYYSYNESHAKSPNSNNIRGIINSFVLTKELCKKNNREDVLVIVFGQQIKSLFSRIYYNNESFKTKVCLLKEMYEFEKDLPKLQIDSFILNFANNLLLKKLYVSSLIFLKIFFSVYKSKSLYKLLKFLK